MVTTRRMRPLAVPGAPERGVGAVGRDQLVVGAEFGDPAVLHHRHPVGVVGRLQAVRDGDDRPALQHGGQRPFRVPGGRRVQQRGRLVQDHRVRVGQHHPGQGELLGLGAVRAGPPAPSRCPGRPAVRAAHSAPTAASAARSSASVAPAGDRRLSRTVRGTRGAPG